MKKVAALVLSFVFIFSACVMAYAATGCSKHGTQYGEEDKVTVTWSKTATQHTETITADMHCFVCGKKEHWQEKETLRPQDHVFKVASRKRYNEVLDIITYKNCECGATKSPAYIPRFLLHN